MKTNQVLRLLSLALIVAGLPATRSWAGLFDVETKLTASDAAAGDRFGRSLGISGSVAIVGEWRTSYGVDDYTSAYLFDADSLSPTFGDELFKLTASDAGVGDGFGSSVAIHGNMAIVGARRDDDGGTASGSAYLFDADPLSPTFGDEHFKLTASDAGVGDRFGSSVAIHGNMAIVGAQYDNDGGVDSGSAYLFDVTTGDELLKLTASDAGLDEHFGSTVAISGSVAIVGKPRDDDGGRVSGAAYVFDADPLSPTFGDELFKLTASDAAEFRFFGWSVGISDNTAIVSAEYDDHAGGRSGSAYLFDVTTGNQLL